MVRLNVPTTQENHPLRHHQLYYTNNNHNSNSVQNVGTGNLSNSISSPSSSTSSLNSNASSFEPHQHQHQLQHQLQIQHLHHQHQHQHHNQNPSQGQLQQQQRSASNIVMVVPQPQQQAPLPQAAQQQPQYTHGSAVTSQHQHPHAHHVHHQTPSQPNSVGMPIHQQQPQVPQQSPTEGSTSSLPASPPLLQQTATPPQGAQLVQPVCAVHHPQQHQQQLALVAAMHQHLAAAAGLGPPQPQHMHRPHGSHVPAPQTQQLTAPPGTLTGLQAQSQVQVQATAVSTQQPQSTQHSQQHSIDNGHAGICSAINGGGNSGSSGNAPGISPSGSSNSSVGSATSSSGNAIVAAAPPPSASGQLYIQYPGEFYPTEYYITPHPHDSMCPQHPHHHQTLCAMPTDYGPTAVQMVSQNRPAPIPVPVQVPQGQVVQQYVNESGPFAHVVLSPQYQQLHASQGHIHAPFLTSNGTSHFYSPLPAGFPAGTGSGPAHFHALSSGHVQPQQPPQQQQAPTAQHQQASSLQPLSHSPSPPNSYHKDERTQRQHTKLLRKLEKQRELNSGMSTPTHSPSPRRNDLNGHHNHSLATTNNSSDGNGSNTHNYATAISGMLTSATTTASSSVTTTNNSNNSSMGSNYNLQNKNQNQYHVSKQPSLSQQILNNHSFHSRRTPQKNDCIPVNAHQLNNINGEAFACITSSVNTSDGGMEGIPNAVEDEEDFQSLIIEQLSAIQKPDVINLTSRSAKIIWEAPVITDPHINTRELRYNVLFSDRAKECKYKSLYKGESYDCIVQDLQPGQVYVVRLQVHYEKLQGSASDPTEFTTPPCVPDQPAPPKLVMRTKNSLHLRWTNPLSNGSPIQHYLLEYDEGKTCLPATSRSARQNTGSEVLHFVEATKTKGKHYTLTKLQPSTVYNFRLAAINEVGASLFSSICSYSTSSNPPSAPKPPKLQSSSSSSLRLWWERRPQDSDYVLQILDRESGHGYLNAFNGPDCVHECCQLRRATSYQFRLRAENEAGCSPWSNEVTFQTSPEKPGKPGKPHVKGKIHGTHFRTRWDPPTDRGGAEILRYFLEITSGTKFERIYSGTDTETICDRLQPGTTYQLRTSCEGPAGLSPYSDVAHITSEAIVPAAPPPPYYDNPPGPYATVLRLDKPDYNGGAPVLEFEVQMRRPLDVHFDIENKTNEYSIIYRGRDTYCVVKDLQPGCPYEVQVRAINRIGAGAWSPWFRFSAAAAPPNAPHNIKVVVKSATHLYLNWQEPDCNGAPILEYHLESATGRNESNSGLEETSEMPAYQTCYQGVQTSVDLRNLLPFTVYYFRVNANNTAGVGKWSTSINARTPAAAPAAPQIKDCEFTATEVSLNWTEPECNGAAITAYVIEYAERSITTPNTNPSYTVTGLMSETTYKFRLQAINSIGPGPFSAYAKLTTLPSPPAPPALECTGVGHNFIKLKWADGKNLDFTKYYVEMFVQRAKEFQIVYSGTNCMCKVNKLQERTSYTFRIYASTDRAGIGDYSDEYTFSTTPTLPSSIKAPRVAMEGAAACLLTHGAGAAGGFIPSGMLAETHTSFIAGLGNLSLGVPLTLEWQNSKNTFNDRVEYLLQYAIGKDGDYKRIYRGAETKFTIENLEPGTMYQFRVCPIRVTSSGEDLVGQNTSAFRYQVPHLASLDDIDSSLLGNMSSVFGGAAGANNNGNASMGCHGHSHHVHGLHTHHSHSHTHHNSRQSASGLHHRSVSASAASPNGCSGNGGINGNGSSNIGGNTILIGPNAIGLIPLGTAMANELAAVGFASCDDPLHHHHHHHHQFHGGNVTAGPEPEVAASTAASFLAATANSLLPNNALLAHASISANHVQNGAVRRCMSKIATLYTNRKRFTDQEKAILFMICFLFFTFLFATLVKTLMR
ncbi:fibronectin type-III domain-containing protein 3A isoform X2 [Anastrepha obliqua]|uniref:fibronectin type-III domain-containing protein 3A isoform X2 n=1 Tax=Anastrepha obliqua TaxID=95512 RepID=UPI0024096DEF|nr:fibronectin type-III domain-containing protein 3A isoform X2 [Anastrepha obliqua]XP_054742339.1 fibronectin type-III domain-containing protein 3A isoform X2 [Anastrepha obliqua]